MFTKFAKNFRPVDKGNTEEPTTCKKGQLSAKGPFFARIVHFLQERSL